MRTNLLLVIVVVAAVYVAALPAPAIPGGWFPIGNVDDPDVQDVGGWAVAEHVGVANDGLKFVKVVSGERQVVNGVNYRLDINALNPAGEDATYTAAVYEQCGDGTNTTRQLISFGPADS